jgi:hypothetical protein
VATLRGLRLNAAAASSKENRGVFGAASRRFRDCGR